MMENIRMLLGEKLNTKLQVFPEYDRNVGSMQPQERLLKLNDLYDIYVPSAMSQEIYCKLYVTLMKSLKQKETVTAVRQSYENRKCVMRQQYKGLMGGVDAFTIIGISGIGKSTSISRAITVIEEQVQMEKILPFVVVQCPFDSSAKGLLLEILREVDRYLGTDYHDSAKRKNATTDILIGIVSQVCLENIGILIVDEIQQIVNYRHGTSLIGMLTQLINNSGIGICMVGTPECTVFFEQAMQMARRSLGLLYPAWDYGDVFRDFCRKVFRYQYVQHPCDCTEDILYWLYEHSGGVVSVVVSLLHDSQEIAILSGHERLDLMMLEEAYQKRLSLLHSYVHPKLVQASKPKRKTNVPVACPDAVAEEEDEAVLVKLKSDDDFWKSIAGLVKIEEVAV